MKLSASRIKALDQCSWKFFCNNILRLPEETHPKTYAGIVCHEIFEYICYSKHKKHLYLILNGPFESIDNSPAIARLIRILIKKYKISNIIAADIPAMILVGLRHLKNRLDNGGEVLSILKPEYKFNLNNGKYELNGVIDLAIEFKDYYLILDWKSQKLKFTEDELNNNIQAKIYQLALKKQFNKPSKVEFVLLRHPDKKKKKDNFIQTVDITSFEELDGLESYLESMAVIFNEFGYTQASENFLASDSSQRWFCNYVCKFKKPFEYYAVIGEDGQNLRTAKSLEELAPKAEENVFKKNYGGCSWWY